MSETVVTTSVRCMCMRMYVFPFGFVVAIASLFMHGFQNNLTQMISLMSKNAA